MTRLHLLRAFCAGFAAAATATASLAAPAAPFNPDSPTALEKLSLPPYCQDGGTAITAACGVFMNHYCGSLNFLNRANDIRYSKELRKRYMMRSRDDMNYTLAKMPPSCPFAPDINATNMRLKVLESILK